MVDLALLFTAIFMWAQSVFHSLLILFLVFHYVQHARAYDVSVWGDILLRYINESDV